MFRKNLLSLSELSSELSINIEQFPNPGPALMQYTCDQLELAPYLLAGGNVAIHLCAAISKVTGRHLSTFHRILDFGCGAGRLLEFLPLCEVPEVYACDILTNNIEFVKDSYPQAISHTNAFAPPLQYESNFFGLIYSFSVFSHLSLESEIQ